MSRRFNTIRFSLFTQSFAGEKIAGHIRKSDNQSRLILLVSKTLLFNSNQVRCFVLHKTCKRKFLKANNANPEISKKIEVYLKIEKQLCALYQEKIHADDLSGDYEYGLLDLAIERVAGNSLAQIANDREFDAKLPIHKAFCEHWYYDITRTYRLPTIRIIPFILRLITL